MQSQLITKLATGLVAGLIGLSAAGNAQAQRDFSGETIRIVVGFSAGGGYDFYGRLLGRHLPKYLEGNPDVVVQNMPGAGSSVAANFMFNRAESDGTTIGFIDGGNAVLQLTGGSGVQFDLQEFQYMGGFSENEVVVVSTELPHDTPQEVFHADEPVRFGHFGGGSFHTTYISILRDAMDSNAQLVGGYGGASEVVPAIERGEVHGTALTYGTILPHINRGAVRPVVMSGPRTEGLEGVPTAMKVAPTERGKTMLEIMNGVLEGRRIFVLPPDTPSATVEALQSAYEEALHDETLLEEARSIMMKAVKPPDEIAEAFKDVLSGG